MAAVITLKYLLFAYNFLYMHFNGFLHIRFLYINICKI